MIFFEKERYSVYYKKYLIFIDILVLFGIMKKGSDSMGKRATAILLDSLQKVFDDEVPNPHKSCDTFQGFKNEVISFQVAYRGENPDGTWYGENHANVEVISPIKNIVRVRRINLVPVGFATFEDADNNYLRFGAGMYPDLLSDLENLPSGQIRTYVNHWRSLWIDVTPDETTTAGIYPVKIQIVSMGGEILAFAEAQVEILDANLPKQKLIRSNWLHADCLAQYYGVETFGEEHWYILEQFIQTAVNRGINTVLVPAFTPPLDTAFGGERPTVQLVGVKAEGEKYEFDFSKFDRWIELCKKCGMEYFEISHLFTQWGAGYAPKIMADVNGKSQRIFGWDTPASSPQYRCFLTQYLPKLTQRLKALGIDKRTFFHISDEPSIEHLENYKAVKDFVAPYLKGFSIIDALSDFEFYQQGVLDKPIPSNDHIEPFLKAGVRGLWTYYCVGQYKDVSNLFIAMPSARTRILGVQLYKFKIEGFLQWGYNFYYSQYSGKLIEPYFTTDADGFVPAGDPFQVYPGRNGRPEESIRLMICSQAMYDIRAFEMLESLTSYEYVMQLIEQDLSSPITFSEYPKEEEYILNLRKRVNEEILTHLKKG